MISAALGFMHKAVSCIKENIINHNLPKRTLVLLPGIASLVFVLIFMFTFNVSVATAVSYNGQTIGYVSSETVYTEAIENIETNMDDKAKAELRTIDAKDSITAGAQIMDKEGLEKAIVDSIDNVDVCYVLYRDSEAFAACKTRDELRQALDRYLSKKAKKLNNATYVDNFKIEKEYRTYDALTSADEVFKLLVDNKVAVAGTKTETVTKKIPYKTVTKKSSKYNKGEKVILRKGTRGEKTIKRAVYYSNGKAVNTRILRSKVTKEPVEEIIVVGTAENSFTLSYPFSKNAGSYITSPYGDYRGYYYHQGIDIIAPYGTEILACAGGTVVEAQYSPYGWGNNVVIQHANGMRTRYAHCSSLNVSVGQKVARGEVIGFVGATGDASCNHLHLELVSGGARINAANYFIN